MLPAPCPTRLVLGPEPVSFGSSFLKSLAGDIEIGVPEFDDTFQIVSETPHLLMHVLTPQVRILLVRYKDVLSGRNLVVEGSVVRFTRPGMESDPAKQKLLVELLVTLAHHNAALPPARA